MATFIHIRKESLKFSAAHMTVFPDGTKESLHGHNFQTAVEVELPELSVKEMISFSVFKTAMKKICDEWDEKLLLANDCPFFKKMAAKGKTFAFELCGKTYSLPRDEVILIPTDNITTENLAKVFAEKLITQIDKTILKKIISLRVQIDEIPGQGGSYLWKASR